MKISFAVSALWVGLALIFNYGIYIYRGEADALNFLTGYLIEKSLSIDNLFVFTLIFNYFGTPKKYQYKVLFWGILGAIVMRAFFIFCGIALVNAFHWVLYVFGVFLLYAAIKMIQSKDLKVNLQNNYIIRLLKKLIPVTESYEEGRFFVFRINRWLATPLFAVLLTVEATDLVFALDSIPAIMGITRDPFIIYTSNIFAILGLRALYFALSDLMALFHFLHYGLAIILAFVGCKMLLQPFIEIPVGASLGFIVCVLITAIAASLKFSAREH